MLQHIAPGGQPQQTTAQESRTFRCEWCATLATRKAPPVGSVVSAPLEDPQGRKPLSSTRSGTA